MACWEISHALLNRTMTRRPNFTDQPSPPTTSQLHQRLQGKARSPRQRRLNREQLQRQQLQHQRHQVESNFSQSRSRRPDRLQSRRSQKNHKSQRPAQVLQRPPQQHQVKHSLLRRQPIQDQQLGSPLLTHCLQVHRQADDAMLSNTPA
ncbi:hypothetical protein BCR37DRAFT_265975 [Protomyces lactucae-debilis]|uniref:Uncharacterized protein n=1 Tax=Protomyces lactucae-debilis TaxID=2754530 RepID=A0A1Y2FMF5_PROLT|nr:uncharacterized protein BCR37DRAFT_265975 [Protomyces lactucae-debilis]ORY84406.1 hypothetical protein BCR37DRAFT_265975 [Protomyces lactucae-debilis]